MRVEVIGTFIIVLGFVGSYLYFLNRNHTEIQNRLKLKEMFFYHLEQQTRLINKFEVALAGGDDNNEVPVKDAIGKINMCTDVRIKKYE